MREEPVEGAPGVTLSDDPARVDRDRAHGWIAELSYWAKGIPRATFERALDGSRLYGAYHVEDGQIAFARTITDGATFAYLADVFVAPAWRGKGVSKALVDFIHADPALAGLRRWVLATADAHTLYERRGWTPLADPSMFLERHDPDVYRR